MERRLAALEREQREHASGIQMLMELVEDSMPVAQCHELLASLEERVSSPQSPPATAAAADGQPAVVDALRGDIEKLLETKLEQKTSRLSNRLGEIETMEEKMHTLLKELTHRIHDDLAEALGQELAEAVQEMAGMTAATQQMAEQNMQGLTERLEHTERAAVQSNDTTQKSLDRLRVSTAQEAESSSDLIDMLQTQLQEATGKLENMEGFVTEQLQECERRQQQHIESTIAEANAKYNKLVTQLDALTAHNKGVQMDFSKQAQTMHGLESRCTAAENLCKQLEATIDATKADLCNNREDMAEALEAQVASINMLVSQQYMDIQTQLGDNEAAWKGSRQDDADQLVGAIQSLEQAMGEHAAEHRRQLNQLEATLSHNVKLQADSHERRCAELKGDIATASALLRREQADSMSQMQLEARSTIRDVEMLRHQLEQEQLRTTNAIEEFATQTLHEQQDSLLQIDARIVQVSAECRDMIASSRRSFERQIETNKDTLTRQRVDGDAHAAAERKRLSTQVAEALAIVKRSAKTEVEARSALERSIIQQVTDSVASAASTSDALLSKLDATKAELEGRMKSESAAHEGLIQGVRSNLELQLTKKISEMHTSLRENILEQAAHITAVESKFMGGLEHLQKQLDSQRAETAFCMSTQEDKLATTVRELTSAAEETAQALRADIVRRSEAAHGSLKQAMDQVDKRISSKADTSAVEGTKLQLSAGLEDAVHKVQILEDRFQGIVDTAAATKIHLLNEIATADQAAQNALRAMDKAMRGDFLKSSLGIRKDFSAADNRLEAKVVGLISEVRDTMRTCVSKTDIQILLSTIKMELDETRDAVQELEGRTEEVSAQGATIEAELAELAVDLSLMDTATVASS